MAKSTKELVSILKAEETKEILKDIYVNENVIDAQVERYIGAVDHFVELFGEKEVELFSAPGRTEVSGNHTDHQKGKVLASSLNLDIIAVVHPLEENVIRIQSEGYPLMNVDLNNLAINEKEFGTTRALIKGVAANLKELGYEIGGFEAYATSEVLGGSGMSSSAAYEILIGTIFSGLYNDMKIDSVQLAKTGQYAENVYFGKPCGLMDQMACSVGGLIYIDFEDPKNPIVKKVDVDFDKYNHSLCIVDTKGSHADLTGDYAAVPDEMKKVAAFFGKEVLREVCPEEFMKNIAKVREVTGDRGVLRAIHFFEENKRVESIVENLEKGDFDAFLEIIKKSGASSFQYLQNVYANAKVQEQGLSVGLAVSDITLGEKGAYRVHGGGFAGTIQAFVPDEMVDEYKSALDQVFGEGACQVLKVRKYGGIKVL